MSIASTTREEVKALAKRVEDRIRDAIEWGQGPSAWALEIPATLRALLDERDAAQAKADDYARVAYDAARKAAKANIDATALAGLDAMEIQPVLMAVQEWAISTGKARDLLRCWIVGTFTPDMLPQQMRDLGLSDDDDPAEYFLAVRAERDAARARIEELSAEVERMREHIADLHNRVRHEFSAAVEAATDKAFKAMGARAALVGAPRHD